MEAVRVDEIEIITEVYDSYVAEQIDDTLAALAIFEADFELDRETLLEWSGPELIKQRFLHQLETRHTRKREWLVQHLAELHNELEMWGMINTSSRMR
jgi:hypothetical protein